MNNNKIRKSLAIFLSITFHFVILFFSYKPELKEIKVIQVSSMSFVNSSQEEAVTPKSSEKENKVKNDSKDVAKIKNSVDKNTNIKNHEEKQNNAPLVEEDKKINEENLYKKGSEKSTVDVSIIGWELDFFPNIEDNSSEVGRIVFEIEIDDDGYVIGVKTLEKTVSNLVEEVYKKGLFSFTFSKTSESNQDQEKFTTKGHITFNIKYKN